MPRPQVVDDVPPPPVTTPETTATTPPNLVIVVLDDAGVDVMPQYETPFDGGKAITPVLDQLASEGIVFEHA